MAMPRSLLISSALSGALLAIDAGPAGAQQPGAGAPHRLQELEAAAGVRAREPDQPVARAVDDGEIALDVRCRDGKGTFLGGGFLAANVDAFLFELEERAARLALEIFYSSVLFDPAQRLSGGRLRYAAEKKDNRKIAVGIFTEAAGESVDA